MSETADQKILRLENELAAAGRNIYELQLWTKKEVNRIYKRGYDKACDDAADIARRSAPVIQCMSVAPIVQACDNIACDIEELKEGVRVLVR